MQPNSIVLPVDELNNETTVNHTYTRYEETLNKSTYISGTSVPVARDMLQLYRTPHKVSGNFRGVSKSAIKFTEDIIVDGVDGISQITAPIIVEVSFSVPVGATAAQTLLARQKALACLDLDSVMAPLNDQLMV